MPDDHQRAVPDHGPWSACLTSDGKATLSSDDFHHDATLTVSGDFGSAQTRLRYAQYLATILTTGCRRQRAHQELEDDGGLLEALRLAASGPEAELLSRASDEIARLRVALTEAKDALEQLEASRYFRDKVAQAVQPSLFAEALQEALRHR